MFLTLLPLKLACAQQTASPITSETIQRVVQRQLEVIRRSDLAFQYKLLKSDEKGTTLRYAIDTPTGRVGRVIGREGQPPTSEVDEVERTRLRRLIDSSSDQKRKLKADESSRKLTEELVSAMPSAMIYTLRPGQPQLPQFHAPQSVIDFKPSPDFHPATTAQEALRGLQGTLWIDKKTLSVLRMEGEIIHNINLMLGIAARVYPGGKIEFEQQEFSPGRMAFSKLNLDVTVREVLFKTVHYRSSQTATEFKRLPDNLPLPAAAKMLLDMPVAISRQP